jgi:predicted peroxiredoxin/TusA-related sulfurtransferase
VVEVSVQNSTGTTLDLRGRTITTYLAFELHTALADLGIGDCVDVVTDAFTAIDNDLRAWCRATGNPMVGTETTSETWRCTIEKGPTRRSTRGYTAIVQDDGLLELLAPLGFALAAALEGHDVALYFQGPAVKVLRRGFVPRLHGLARPFSRFPRLGLEQAGHVAPIETLRQIQRFGSQIYASGPSMDHFKVSEDDLALDGVVVAE